ncbi:MAG: hypothetical protein HYW50_04580 [Candidatus Diapherotrites archaeon]|nr:hypothetical protein [Candidatus Diapherotrites archaeon]
MPKGFFIQYKFIIPPKTKHSSYNYQKLFRAIYGYTQNVSKSNGKTYKYHRKGVLSSVPYIRPGKNCVIIPSTVFNSLTSFFKTGKNPTHVWEYKGDWKAVYYMDEKDLKDFEVIKALEELLERTYLLNSEREPQPILKHFEEVLLKSKQNNKIEKAYIDAVLSEGDAIVSTPWFKEIYLKSEKLVNFFNNFKSLKALNVW